MKCNPPKSILDSKKRIIVIGDIHADWEITKKIFLRLRLIDLNDKWIAIPKNTIVVQLGDQLDGKARLGSDAYGEIKILDFLDFIDEQAKFYGGGVYSLIGYHEIMNVQCNFNYVSNLDYTNNRCIKFQPGGSLSKRLACTRNTILKVGDFIFVHAGILPNHIKNIKGNFIEKINTEMRKYLLTGKIDPEIENLLFKDKDSLLWTRKYDNKDICKNISDVTNFFKVKSIIVGHSVQNEITSMCDKKIWKVDVGLSKSMGNNNIQVLEILDNGKANESNKFNPIRVIDIK